VRDIPRILIVDDHPDMLKRVTDVLSPSCEIVGAVQNGPAALDAVVALQPDVIVLDISMTGMSGLEVAGCVRRAGSNAAIVFLTAHADEDVMSAARSAGGIGYVIKPRLDVDLLRAVKDARAGHAFVSPLH
jgi:DNA-binding NarL/FixJ family response regulator